MKSFQSALGEVRVGESHCLYGELAARMQELARVLNHPPGVALTGGSSPKAFYDWLLSNPSALPAAREGIVFTVSDERCVPTESPESNYGNALRAFFEPFPVAVDNRFPWDTSRIPADAAIWYQQLWELSFGSATTYDLCLLGMGDDCHTASLFPGSPLLCGADKKRKHFASVHVDGKGDRLTITPSGLAACRNIVVLVTGMAKAAAVERVFKGPQAEAKEIPVHLFRNFPGKVTWMLDEAAASRL
jgi:6-phosphogluconolactonase